VTLVLTAPQNYVFNAGQGNVSHLSDRDILSSLINVTTKTITVTFATDDGNNGRNDIDQITISNIQVQAIDGNNVNTQNILRTSANPGTATIAGITNGSTNFGNLSLDEDSPLPVELSSFIARYNKIFVLLNWETKTEINNFGFDIERQYGKDWEKIGFVEGNGNSNSLKSYSFTDENIKTAGKYFYRLKQIDNDGAFKYSKVLVVDIELPSKYELLQNFPNPFNPVTLIKYSIPENAFVNISVYNVLGEKIETLINQNLESGAYEISFSASEYPSGIYYYKIEAGNFISVKKMIILK
jgi:hypothetical protein